MTLPRACIVLPLDEAASARIAPSCEMVRGVGLPREEVLGLLGDAEGLLCSALFPIDRSLLEAAPRLRVVSNMGVGYNNIEDLEEMTRRGIAVCNTPGVLSAAVADLTIGLILAASRRIVDHANYVKAGGWSARQPQASIGFDLEGKTIGLIGYGRIGREVAKRARAFGLRVVFYDVFTAAPEGDPSEYRPLDDLLRESDIVSVHVNLTADTTHMISTRELGLMKPTAWIVNTARGPSIDEVALAEALHAGTIAGAALDVVEVEPPPEDAPILRAPNTIILPHVGSATRETRQAMLELCLDNLAAVLSGREPRAIVNPEALPRALQRSAHA